MEKSGVVTVCVALEARFLRLPDGSVWTQVQCAFPFWQRYLDVFDHVRCIARTRDVARLEGEWQRADGPGVSFSPIADYVGPTEFLKRVWRLREEVRRSFQIGDAVVLRVPGNVGGLLFRRLKSLKDYPFGVEVVGDPYDALAPGSVEHPLRPFLRWQQTRQLDQPLRECVCGLLCNRTCAAATIPVTGLHYFGIEYRPEG